MAIDLATENRRILVKIDSVAGGHAGLTDLLDLTRLVEKRVIKAEQDYLEYICRELRRLEISDQQIDAGRYAFDRELRSARILIITDLRRSSWELYLLPSGLITPLAWRWVVKPILKQVYERLKQSGAIEAVHSILPELPYDHVRQIAVKLNGLYAEAPDRFWGYVLNRLAPLRHDQSKAVPKDDRLIVIKQTVDDALDGSLMDDMKTIGDLL
jgi:hypothetical protein